MENTRNRKLLVILSDENCSLSSPYTVNLICLSVQHACTACMPYPTLQHLAAVMILDELLWYCRTCSSPFCYIIKAPKCKSNGVGHPDMAHRNGKVLPGSEMVGLSLVCIREKSIGFMSTSYSLAHLIGVFKSIFHSKGVRVGTA